MRITKDPTRPHTPSNAREGNGLPARLTRLREDANMTQDQAAKIFRVNRSTYAYYETGKSHPKYPVLCRIASAYGVTAGYLLGIEDMPQPPAGQLHDAEVPYDANNQQESSYLRGKINDSVADLSNVERTVLFRLRIMDKADQKGVVDFINTLAELNKEEWEMLFRLSTLGKEDQKTAIHFINDLAACSDEERQILSRLSTMDKEAQQKVLELIQSL